MPALPPLASRDRRVLRTHILTELERVDEALRSSVAGSPATQQLAADRSRLADVLARTDVETFGVCGLCGSFVGVERLLALPDTDRCSACAPLLRQPYR